MDAAADYIAYDVIRVFFDGCASGEVAVDVRDVYNEQDWSEYAPLDDSGFDTLPLGCQWSYLHSLSPPVQVGGYPPDQPGRQVFLQLQEQTIMWHQVERLGEIEEDGERFCLSLVEDLNLVRS